MPTLTINPTYSSNTVLTASQLDSMITPVETLVNTTKLDSVNVDIQDIVDNLAPSQAGVLLRKRGLGANITDIDLNSAELDTSSTTIASVTATEAGTYLVSVYGFLSLERSTASATDDFQATGFFQIYNNTTTTAVGPEILVNCAFGNTGSRIVTMIMDLPVTLNYITTIAAGDVIQLRAYRTIAAGVQTVTAYKMYLNAIRLKI